MKKNHALGIAAAVFLSAAAITLSGYPVQAAQPVKSQTTVYNDMTIGPVDVGGMTKAEAEQAVNEYVEGLLAKKITLSLQGSDEKKIEATIADMGFAWANPELLNGIGSIGKGGNIIRRYKMMKDMENTPLSFEMEFSVDAAKIQALLEAKLPELEVAAVDAVLTRTEEGFSITPETVGITVDVPASVSIISEYLLEHWNYEDCAVSLMAATLYPNITKADCEKIGTEPMGEFMTTYYSSSEARSGNIDVAVSKINGSLLMPGERFSCLEHMIPFTAENGYFPAGSYLNGKLVDSFGGGVCQVSTTLYNAVLLAELEVNQRNNHGLTVGYVQLSADAAIAESSGMDFIFTNNTN
ncbi:MAG: VanW family protein, partial [Lachnospiraceae bacterium]|nr:VanW family protein [Lachnospiraceae bacterium]